MKIRKLWGCKLIKRNGLLLMTVAILSACSFEPKKNTIEMNLPTQFKEQQGVWIQAKPKLYQEKKDKWWELYKDETLNALERKINCQNNQLKVAYYQYKESQQVARIARSYLYPSITSFYNMARVENSSNQLTNRNVAGLYIYNTFFLSGLINYEVDLWGKIRSSVKVNDRLMAASKLDMAAISLSLHGQLATDYFLLRSADKMQAILDENVTIYQKVYQLRTHQHRGGLIYETSKQQAYHQLQQAKLLQVNNQIKRSQLEHSIAVLTGETPSLFNICPAVIPFRKVSIYPRIPSLLLERRPDVVAAQYRVMSAKANIGYARAAFFPAINLFGLFGGQSSDITHLFSKGSLFWSLGPSAGTTVVALIRPMVSQTIFDGFRLPSQLNQAWYALKLYSAQYRQTVLTAFKEVEDQLVEIRKVDENIEITKQDLQAVDRQYYQALQRQKGGITTYIEVAPFAVNKLQLEIDMISLQARRQIASVALIKALGGSWAS